MTLKNKSGRSPVQLIRKSTMKNLPDELISKNEEIILSVAIENGDVEILKELLNRNPKLTKKKDSLGQTPLHHAAYCGQTEIVQLLLEKKADVNCQDEKGATALRQAAQQGHLEIVKVLLEKKADVNCRSKEGATALHVAAVNGHLEIVRLLLESGADYKVKLANGFVPLKLASLFGHKDVVRLIATYVQSHRH